MDWDDVRAAPGGSTPVVVGESLERHSVDELVVRIEKLEGEIDRVRAELAKKKAHEAAAASIFKS